MDEKEKANILRWDGAQRGFYEVYYLKWNDPASQTAYWIRYTLTAPLTPIGPAYCELWGIFFDANNPSANFGLKQRFPIDRLGVERDHFKVAVDKAVLTQKACNGALKDEAQKLSLEWELTFDSPTPLFRHFPSEKLYHGKFPKSKVMAPHEDAHFNGHMIVNGRKIAFNNARGQQTHIWGVKHALRWAWGHCNCFREDPDAIFEGLDAQIALGPIPSPHLSLFYLRTGGRDYYFNKLMQWIGNHSKYTLGSWNFSTKGDGVRLVGTITSPLEAFVAVTYTDPDGEKAWCNNSKVSTINLELYKDGDPNPVRLSADRACAAEFVDRKTHPGVKVWV